jgi:hypothetical protein
MFWYFFKKIRAVSAFFVDIVCLGCIGFILKQRVSMFLIKPKQTEDQLKRFDREQFLVLFRIFRVVSVCFGLFRNSFVCSSCFDIGSKHQNKPKQTDFFVFGFTKQTGTKPKQILFRFVSVQTENLFCLFRGHPSCAAREHLGTDFLVA